MNLKPMETAPKETTFAVAAFLHVDLQRVVDVMVIQWGNHG